VLAFLDFSKERIKDMGYIWGHRCVLDNIVKIDFRIEVLYKEVYLIPYIYGFMGFYKINTIL
jgi:hypothetical protein